MAKILFLDDVVEIQELYATVLTKRGHVVVVAASAMQGLASLKVAEYDYVFVDLKLPDFDGFYFLREARLASQYPNTKVVILTNSEDEDDYERARELGVQHYLVKIDYSPYGLAQLIDQHKL